VLALAFIYQPAASIYSLLLFGLSAIVVYVLDALIEHFRGSRGYMGHVNAYKVVLALAVVILPLFYKMLSLSLVGRYLGELMLGPRAIFLFSDEVINPYISHEVFEASTSLQWVLTTIQWVLLGLGVSKWSGRLNIKSYLLVVVFSAVVLTSIVFQILESLGFQTMSDSL